MRQELDNILATKIEFNEPETKRFVVYNIDYSRSGAGPSMTVYLSEV